MDAWMRAMRRGNFAAAWKVSDRVLRRHLRMREPCAPTPQQRHGRAPCRARMHGDQRRGPLQRDILPQLCRLARDIVSRLQPRLLVLLPPRPGIGRLEAPQ